MGFQVRMRPPTVNIYMKHGLKKMPKKCLDCKVRNCNVTYCTADADDIWTAPGARVRPEVRGAAWTARTGAIQPRRTAREHDEQYMAFRNSIIEELGEMI